MSYPEDDIFADEFEQHEDESTLGLSSWEEAQDLGWLDFDDRGEGPAGTDSDYDDERAELEGPYPDDFFEEQAEHTIDDLDPEDESEKFSTDYENEDEGYEETIEDEEEFAQIEEALEDDEHFEGDAFDADDTPAHDDEQYSPMFPFTQADFSENLFRHLVESERPTHLSDVNEIAAFAWGPTLRRGSRGGSVRTLQKLLNITGANLSVDGNFGPATQRAVRDFQSSEGLQVDGIVGPRTKAALTNGRVAQGPASPPSFPNQPGTTARPTGGTASSGLPARIVEVAKREWRRWRPGGGAPLHEDNAAAIPIVKEYWRVGVGRNMPTDKINNPNRKKRVAWSAAFISYCMREAGAGDTFRYSGGHWVYVGEAKRNRMARLRNKPFWAYRPNEAPLMTGDLICNWRDQRGRNFTPSYDNMDQKRNWFSHCDIVIAIKGNTAKVLGGNKRDSVRIVNRRLNPDGTLSTSGDQHKFIAVVRCRGELGANERPDPSGSVYDNQSDRSSSLGKVPLFFRGREVSRYQFTEEDKLWAGRLIEGEDAQTGKGQDAVIQSMINRFATIAMKTETRMRYSTFTRFLRAYSSPLFHPSKRRPSAKHARLQSKPFHALIPEAQRLAVAYLSGTKHYADFGNATDFGSVRIWFYRRNGRNPTRSEFESYARAHARRRKYARWVGPIDGLDQYRCNTFFITKTADSLPVGAISVT